MKKALILSMMALFVLSTAMAQEKEVKTQTTTTPQAAIFKADSKNDKKITTSKAEENKKTTGKDLNAKNNEVKNVFTNANAGQTAKEKAEAEKAEAEKAEAAANANAPKPIIDWVKKNYPGYKVYAWGKPGREYEVTIVNGSDSKVIYFNEKFEELKKSSPKPNKAIQNSNNQQQSENKGKPRSKNNRPNTNTGKPRPRPASK